MNKEHIYIHALKSSTFGLLYRTIMKSLTLRDVLLLINSLIPRYERKTL